MLARLHTRIARTARLNQEHRTILPGAPGSRGSLLLWEPGSGSRTTHRPVRDASSLLEALVEQRDGHLNVGRRTGDGDEPLVARSTSRQPSARLHNLDVARRHGADLVDLGAALADDAADEVVGDKDLLRLRARWQLRGAGGGAKRSPAQRRRRAVAKRLLRKRSRLAGRGARATSARLQWVGTAGCWHCGPGARAGWCPRSTRRCAPHPPHPRCSARARSSRAAWASPAVRRAPDASWISLILEPCLPITDPMRELGTMKRIVTDFEPGTDGWSKGSSLILRTIRPKACKETVIEDEVVDRMRSARVRPAAVARIQPCKGSHETYLADSIKRTRNTLEHAKECGGARGGGTTYDVEARVALVADLVDVFAGLADDDAGVAGHDEGTHGDLGGLRLGGVADAAGASAAWSPSWPLETEPFSPLLSLAEVESAATPEPRSTASFSSGFVEASEAILSRRSGEEGEWSLLVDLDVVLPLRWHAWLQPWQGTRRGGLRRVDGDWEEELSESDWSPGGEDAWWEEGDDAYDCCDAKTASVDAKCEGANGEGRMGTVSKARLTHAWVGDCDLRRSQRPIVQALRRDESVEAMSSAWIHLSCCSVGENMPDGRVEDVCGRRVGCRSHLPEDNCRGYCSE
ncbi:hypothetical protein L1887_61388 [Cichorium endivia]|nr:hypothetical protein L1887_61388 [Cichorium endivia]